MDAIDSDSRVSAQLSRLIGLAGAQLHAHLSEAALRAAGALCDFGVAHDMRARCLKAAAAVAAGGDGLTDKLSRPEICAYGLHCDGRDVLGCAVEVLLSLLEGASIRGGPPPEGQSGVVYVTGQRGWLPNYSLLIRSARIAVLFGGQRVMRSTIQSPGDLRRKVVMAAALACAPLPTHETYMMAPATVFRGCLLTSFASRRLAQGAREAWRNALVCA